MTTLHTNLNALFGQRSLSSSQSQLHQSAERLSSGLRINRAKDDNAGLGISQELQRQTRALEISRRNASDGISMAQTAEGALSSVSDILQRMKELTAQGANQSLNKDQRKLITSEIAQLKKEINAVAERTSFNGTRLLNGDFSQKVTREFVNKVGEVEGGALAIKAKPTLSIGQKSSSTLAGASVIQLTHLNTDGAKEGTFKFSNSAEKVTLTRTLNGKSETQTLILSRTGATGGQNVTIPPSAGDSFTLNFDALGVSATFKIDTLGSRKSAEDFGALISSVGQVPAPKGWQLVGGADFASGAPTDQVLATVTSTGGNLKITTTTGLGAIDGYAGSWTAGTATSIGFIGTVEQVNAALRTLQVDATNGIGNLDSDPRDNFRWRKKRHHSWVDHKKRSRDSGGQYHRRMAILQYCKLDARGVTSLHNHKRNRQLSMGVFKQYPLWHRDVSSTLLHRYSNGSIRGCPWTLRDFTRAHCD